MGSTQVDKRCYQNQTAGWLGVVKLDHLGAQVGESIPPHGTIWLTDDEATLTARAPARAEDNPFVPKDFMFVDNATGAHVEQEMTPLVLITDDREVPADDRPTPATMAGPIEAKVAADAGHTADKLAAESDRPVPTEGVASHEVTLVPASSAAVDPAYSRPAVESPEEEPSWTENVERTEQPQPGSLGGQDGAPPAAPSGEPLAQGPTDLSPAAAGNAAVQTPGASEAPAPAAEEHAAQTQTGEETGAAATPAEKPAEGEFAAHEEVGSPDAPAQDAAS